MRSLVAFPGVALLAAGLAPGPSSADVPSSPTTAPFATSSPAIVPHTVRSSFLSLVAVSISAMAMLVAAPVGLSAQTASPTPAPLACAQPNVPAATLEGVEPDTPALAEHYGIGGSVEIIVSLDAGSHVVDASIYRSSNPIFEEPSLAAARASRYRTAVHDCVPRAGAYVFTVLYDTPKRPVLAADPLRYFPGVWTCRDSATGASRSDRFTLGVDSLAEEDGPTARTIARDKYGAWTVLDAGLQVGFAFPWVDTDWVWISRVRMADGLAREEYERLDAAAFKRTRYYETAAGVATKTERCARS